MSGPSGRCRKREVALPSQAPIFPPASHSVTISASIAIGQTLHLHCMRPLAFDNSASACSLLLLVDCRATSLDGGGNEKLPAAAATREEGYKIRPLLIPGHDFWPSLVSPCGRRLASLLLYRSAGLGPPLHSISCLVLTPAVRALNDKSGEKELTRAAWSESRERLTSPLVDGAAVSVNPD